MKKSFNIILTVIVVAVAALEPFVVQAASIHQSIGLEQIRPLHQQPQHVTGSERITSRFLRSHYSRFTVDSRFSEKVFQRYLNMLDYSHNVLLASDIQKFSAKKKVVADELRLGRLTIFFDLYNIATERRFERYKYALSLLNQPLDFTSNNTIDLDRRKAPWPKDEVELNKLWDARVTYDALSLKLRGKNDQEIRETLSKRYSSALRRLTQSESDDVFQLAMNAFAREIDPHTSYLSPRNTEQFNSEMNLSMEGIGAVLKMEDEHVVIHSLIAGGPAAKSKLLNIGDRVVGVGQPGQPLEEIIGWRLDDVVAKIKGAQGSQVRLEILPPGKGAKTHVVSLTREKIRLEDRAVKVTIHTVNKDKIGVLNIPSFYLGLTEDVKKHLQEFEAKNVRGIVIDLRSNGGGALVEAISLSGLFLSSGPIVQVRDNDGRIRQDNDSDGITYYKGPLVVLVDRFSASASEIFAAAMQDYGRAVIIGESTFGKGTVQQYRSLERIYDQMLRPDWPPLGSVQYTIQKFYRINGGSTQIKGVTPDILVPAISKFEEAEIGERFEDNALPWDSIGVAPYMRVTDLKPTLSFLRNPHEKRIANSPEFQYILRNRARLSNFKEKRHTVSLNYEKRKKEEQEDEALRLEWINFRYKREGKKTYKRIDDLPKEYKEPDPWLDETLKIAGDLVQLPLKMDFSPSLGKMNKN